jgi:Zn-dependent protease/CBS domain-containing protein
VTAGSQTGLRNAKPAAEKTGAQPISGWAFRLADIAGIGVYVHVTFLMLIAWVAITELAHGRGVRAMANGVALILAVFGIVVLHELGHALTARRFGIRTRDITLLPIGGVARLERMPEKPYQELLVALAGPAVNVVLAAVLFVGLRLHGSLAGPWVTEHLGGNILQKLLWINVSLAIFNLLPAFPMDGGRALRATLALRLDYVRATEIAARLGQGMALLFGFLGLTKFNNPMIVLIALFVWMGAKQEASMVGIKRALSGIPVGSAMITVFRTLAPDDPLGRAAELVVAGFQHDFPVVDSGRLVGVLTRRDIVRGLSESGPASAVGRVMQSDFSTADPAEMLESVLPRLESRNATSIVVVRGGEVVGMVTTENIGELVVMENALRKARRGASLPV